MSDRDQPAATQSDCALELLEPEIQRHILLQANDFAGIRAIIQASPRFYQVFLLNKQYIFSAVARRQFHPAVLPEALTFAKIAQLEQPCSRETALKFCEVDPGKLRDWQDMISSESESEALFKLASNLKFFIEDYARNTLPIMEGLGQTSVLKVLPEYWPEKPIPYSTLSHTEIGRLQRAFCRFEIYRSLFARCSADLDHKTHECASDPPVKPTEQAYLYLKRFPDYQVAEIGCVRDYMFRRLRGICTQLENEAVDTLSPEHFAFGRDGDVETKQWNSEFYLFTHYGKYDQSAHIEHLMSLGLPYVRTVFESRGGEKRALFLRYDSNGLLQHLTERVFISRALCLLGPNPGRGNIPLLEETDPPFDYEVDSRVELDIPDAWQWAHPRGPPHMLYDGAIKGLRDWGYVFWDLERLRESGILERNRGDVRRKRFNEYEAGEGPSVQQRLLEPLGIWYIGQETDDDETDDDEIYD